MFELGARPHPPQDLYRSYLEQSDVFVGVYWQSYGWVAPGPPSPGIEDEYDLAGDRPRLIYVKEPAPEREPGTRPSPRPNPTGWQGVVQAFDTAETLVTLLLDDLALLVSERFQAWDDSERLSSGTLTFLFADMERSTRLLEELGEEYSELVRTYHAVGRGGGPAVGDVSRVGQATVSSVSSPMPFPRWRLRSRCSDRSPTDVAGWGRCQARIGIHTGSARELPEGYVGIDVHRAARVGEAAQGGQIIVSSTTAALIGDHVQRKGWSLRTLGDFDLRGLTRSERLSQVVVPGIDTPAQPLRARRVGASRVPTPMTSLVGRERDLHELEALLTRPDVRLVTLTGAGGIGKTRLAMEVVQSITGRFADGVGWVALDAVSEPELVPDAIAAALGLIDSGRQSVVDTVSEYLSDKQLLIVLDNFEQVLPPVRSSPSCSTGRPG
jgi:class 3 adenylate cyclase